MESGPPRLRQFGVLADEMTRVAASLVIFVSLTEPPLPNHTATPQNSQEATRESIQFARIKIIRACELQCN